MSKLSVITICYNEPNLEKTCESIVNQTWQDFEWIVIDGGSNADTQKIWDKYKSRIDKFISEPDEGVYDAMNKGISIANGEYLNFLNAGDSYVDKNVLEKVFNKDYKEDILYGDEYYSNFDGKDKYLVQMPKNMDTNYLIHSTIRHQSTFIKKLLFDKYGIYEKKYKIVSDWDKWIVFFKDGVLFKHIPFAIALYDTNGRSCSNKWQEIHDKERQEILHKYFSDSQIEEAHDIYTKKDIYSFIENLFSIKNSKDKFHKIITILGIHIKIRRK